MMRRVNQPGKSLHTGLNLTMIGRFFILAVVWFVVTANAQIRESSHALTQIDSLLSNLKSLRQALHAQDEGRVLVLERLARETRESIQKHGLVHLATNHHFKMVIVGYKYAEDFFRFIRTRRTARAIAETLATIRSLRESLGIDREPSSRTLEAHFLQLKTSIDELVRRDGVPEALRKSLEGLVGKLGDAIAVAGLGDDARTMEIGRQLYADIKRLYPDLYRISETEPLFGISLELRRVNEFIGKFAGANP